MEIFGYIDVETESPLIYQLTTTKYPTAGGPIIASGANNRILKVTPELGSLAVNLDIDGIEGYELSSDLNVSSTGIDIPNPATNTNPVAKIRSIESTITPDTQIILDASLSKDVDNDLIRYQWKLESKPSDSQAAISSTSIETFFTPDVTGTYKISLTVRDKKNAKHTKILSLNVLSKPVLLSPQYC